MSDLGEAFSDISYREVQWDTPASLAPKKRRQDGEFEVVWVT